MNNTYAYLWWDGDKSTPFENKIRGGVKHYTDKYKCKIFEVLCSNKNLQEKIIVDGIKVIPVSYVLPDTFLLYLSLI